MVHYFRKQSSIIDARLGSKYVPLQSSGKTSEGFLDKNKKKISQKKTMTDCFYGIKSSQQVVNKYLNKKVGIEIHKLTRSIYA